MSALEARYRRMLRWYPAEWRATNGNAVIGTLLDAAEAEGRTEPTTAELRDLRWRGLERRGLDVLPQAVRVRAGTLALGVGATLAGIDLVFREWDPWTSPMKGDPSFGPFLSPAAVLDVLWLVALAAAFVGLRAVMRTALVTAAIATIVLVTLPFAPWNTGRPTTTVLLASAALAVVGLMAPRRTSRSAAWIGIAVAATAVAMAFGSANLTYGVPRYSVGFWDLREWAGWFAFGSLDPIWYGFALLVLAVTLNLARRRWWAGAIVIALSPWWIGMDAAHLARSGLAETAWAGLFVLVYVGGLALRAAGYRWRRGNGVEIRP